MVVVLFSFQSALDKPASRTERAARLGLSPQEGGESLRHRLLPPIFQKWFLMIVCRALSKTYLKHPIFSAGETLVVWLELQDQSRSYGPVRHSKRRALRNFTANFPHDSLSILAFPLRKQGNSHPIPRVLQEIGVVVMVEMDSTKVDIPPTCEPLVMHHASKRIGRTWLGNT